MLDYIMIGLETALNINNLMYAFLGVFIGNLIGVLPGIGAMAAVSMLLPITYGIQPAGALMMLAGLYYGTSYGGAITTILLNLPGTASHAVVSLDGHPLAKQGRAGSALLMAMLASFIGSTIGIILMSGFGPVLVNFAFKFGPAEYFSLMLLGLLAASTLTTGSAIKSIAMVVIGVIAGTVGIDVNSGVARYTFGIHELQDGLLLVAVAMGLFGVADVLRSAGSQANAKMVSETAIGWRSLRFKPKEFKNSLTSIFRGAGVGSFFGFLPGTGGSIASFMSYAMEKSINKNRSQFGKGALEGVASPESANSSAAQTAFIPTLSLGIPGDAVMALILGAMMIHNIQPGPQLMVSHPDIFWGLIASFWIGNLMLLFLNIPLVGIWVRLLTVPYRFIFPAVLLFICIGAFSANNNIYDVLVVLVIGVFGYVATKLEFDLIPMLLGLVLGPMVEENFRRAMVLSQGDMTVFLTRPISATCVGLAFLLVFFSFYKNFFRR